MKYDVGDELTSPSGRATVVGYVYWDGAHRYYVHWRGETQDMFLQTMEYFKFRKVTNEEQSAV